jgi:hypothetical protein
MRWCVHYRYDGGFERIVPVAHNRAIAENRFAQLKRDMEQEQSESGGSQPVLMRLFTQEQAAKIAARLGIELADA